MSKTAVYATTIKQQLESLQSGLKEQDHVYRTIHYVLDRLWPELESAIKEELPDGK